ncbi:MAG: tetratricopeptide repeat protein, partial [Steroidobacteraceae bacterium]|nr:tetratricopeptide repeat protein [Steroidobacteraceae bacterium]
VAATAGVAGVVYQAREARAQTVLAQREAEKATSIKDYLLAIFEANEAAHPDGAAARKTTAEELMRMATKQVLETPDKDAEVRFELMDVLNGIHAGLESFEEQEALNNEKIRVAEQGFGKADIRVADAYNDYSEFLRSRQRYDESIAAANRAVQLRESQGDGSSLTRGKSEVQLGQVKFSTFDGVSTEPADHFLSAIRILEKIEPSHDLARAYLGLARTYEYMSRYEEAIEANKQGIRISAEVDGPKTTAVGGGHQQMSRALVFLKRFDEAEEHLNQAIEILTFANGPDGGFTINATADLGRLHNRRGRFREGAAVLEKVLENRVRVVGPQDVWTQQVRTALLTSLVGLGDFERAREIELPLVAGFVEKKNQRLKLGSMRSRSMRALEEGRARDALAIIDDAQALFDTQNGPPGPMRYYLLLARAETLAALGRTREARAAVDAAQPLLAEKKNELDANDGQYEPIMRARVELAEGQAAVAADRLVKVVEFVRGSKRRDEIWNIEALALSRLADAQFAAGNAKAACAALDGSIELRTANALPIDPRLAAAKKLKGRCNG